MRLFIIILFCYLGANISFAQQRDLEIPYTQADRDRLVRVETRLDNVDKRLDGIESALGDVRTEMRDGQVSLRKEIRDGQASLRKEMQEGQAELRNSINNLIYSIFGLISVLIALVIWDRRTAIRPVASALETEKETVKEEVRYRKRLIKVLKVAAEKDANIREAMKHAGLL